MNPNEQSPQKIYVAPDGSRILGAPNQTSGLYQARPAPSRAYSTAPTVGAPMNASGSAYGGSPSMVTASSQINVGLLAWGVILVIFGVLLVFSPLFGASSLQTLLVITFAIAGIAFLALAYVTSKGDQKLPERPTN